jgi:pyridoxine 4-dehydrogenase
MNRESKLGGTFSLPGTPLNLYRMGYGAMQLAGPGGGLPPNIDEAVAVLRDAVPSKLEPDFHLLSQTSEWS